MKARLFFIVSFIFAFVALSAQQIEEFNGAFIESKYVVFKVKPQLLKSTSTSSEFVINQKLLDNFLESIDATLPEQKFPHSIMPLNCNQCVDISRIYSFSYSSDMPIGQVLGYLQSLAIIEYAEPNYIHQFLSIPNDTDTPHQWHMNTSRIYQAWDLEQGDTNVVIGVTDSGFDIDHKDLVEQIKYNYKDPINGLDDDYDGYVDNFRGWDFGNKDNNPDLGVSDHGTWVAGISSAQVNNAFGIAGVANTCKFLPIKIATDAGYITRGYEGIVYAANQKCKIINCSWGSVGTFTQQGEDVINYATFNCNALVIAAAGNSSNTDIFYPASFKNALSVAGTMPTDEKWSKDNSSSKSGSNWNYYVDVSSPAADYYSTSMNDGTTRMYGGTSFASPVVSGIAALVASKFSTDSALSIGERVRATCDDIYGITYNAPYTHLLGSGRVNAYDALTDNTTPSVRMVNFKTKNRSGQYMYYAGDTMELTITFKNYLAQASNLFITLSCESSLIAPLNANILIPSVAAGEQFTVIVPFTFKIVSTMPADIKTNFKIMYSAGIYFGYEYVPVSFNPSYYDFEVGNFKATATADGTIGIFNPTNKKEFGIVYKDYPNMVYDAGLVLAQNDTLVASRLRGNNDFQIIQFPTILPSDSTDVLIYSRYINNQMNLDISQYLYAWEDKDFLIHEYRITNLTDSTIHNLHAGVYFDWTIVSQQYNKVRYVDSLQLAHVSTLDPLGFYAGVMPLHYHKSGVYALNDASGADSVYCNDGINDSEMWYLLTHHKTSAGADYDGGSVSSMSHAIVGELPQGATQVIRYALFAGDSFKSISDSAIALKKNYITDTTTWIPPNDIDVLDDCNIDILYKNNTIEVVYPISSQSITFSLFDVQGKLLQNQIALPKNQDGIIRFNLNGFSQGMYVVKVAAKGKQQSYKINTAK